VDSCEPCRATPKDTVKIMWYYAHLRLPYQDDPDYRDSIVAAIRSVLSDAPIDITLLGNGYRRVEVDTDEAGARVLGERLDQFTMFRPSVDRGMLAGERVIV
jgi:hypothetical protein